MSNQYITVAASQTAQKLHAGNNNKLGVKGDTVTRLIITSTISATAAVTLIDDTTSIPITTVNTPIGVYVVELGIASQNGGWAITTGAGASVVAVGIFA